jgi:hypothetical protein
MCTTTRLPFAHVLASFAVILASCVLAAHSVAQSPSLAKADAGDLTVGEFVWRPELAPSGPFTIVIDLRAQRAFVYCDNVLIGISTISSGKPGYETPTGTFAILEKEKFHRSNEYNDAPMPFMQRLTWDGLALHGGYMPGYPDSHGCVRLPLGFARALFNETTIGTKVIITDHEPDEEDSPAS